MLLTFTYRALEAADVLLEILPSGLKMSSLALVTATRPHASRRAMWQTGNWALECARWGSWDRAKQVCNVDDLSCRGAPLGIWLARLRLVETKSRRAAGHGAWWEAISRARIWTGLRVWGVWERRVLWVTNLLLRKLICVHRLNGCFVRLTAVPRTISGTRELTGFPTGEGSGRDHFGLWVRNVRCESRMYGCVLGRFGGVFAEVAAVIHTSGSANLDGRKNLCFSFGVPDMSLFFQKNKKSDRSPILVPFVSGQIILRGHISSWLSKVYNT